MSFRLSPLEANTPLWALLRAHLETRLARLRKDNDEPRLDATQTAILRGRIAELRLLLVADKPGTDAANE